MTSRARSLFQSPGSYSIGLYPIVITRSAESRSLSAGWYGRALRGRRSNRSADEERPRPLDTCRRRGSLFFAVDCAPIPLSFFRLRGGPTVEPGAQHVRSALLPMQLPPDLRGRIVPA